MRTAICVKALMDAAGETFILVKGTKHYRPAFRATQRFRRSTIVAFPNAEARKLIEDYSARIPDSQERLRFVLRASRAVTEDTSNGPPNVFGGWGRRLVALHALCRSSLVAKESLGIGFDGVSLFALWLWRTPSTGWKMALASAGLLVMLTQVTGLESRAGHEKPSGGGQPGETLLAKPEEKLDVWLVETRGQVELYSNGLLVSNEWLTHTGPRSYAVYSRGPGSETRETDRRDRPMGLVFHTTESELPTLEKTNNQLIRYEGRKLVNYIRREQLYHFLIDRFGRVYRIVPETEYAYHAGYSLWADSGELYINLNQSFIGISFETRPAAIGPDVPVEEGVTPAQFSSAHLLTEMLREKFGILESNCVTHEMISVNPNKMLIGYHMDWRGRFPFEKVGLPDNYQAVLASVAEWGFTYDSPFLEELGGQVWPGVRRSHALFRREAALRQLSAKRYREQQGKRFLALVREVKETTPALTWADHDTDRSAQAFSSANNNRATHEPE